MQFPSISMGQLPSPPPLIPSSTLLPLWPFSHNDELLLAMEESQLEDKIPTIRYFGSENWDAKELWLGMRDTVPGALEWRNQLNEIRKTNSNMPVIGKSTVDYKEEFDADAEDDDPDNVEESEGDDFEQETG